MEQRFGAALPFVVAGTQPDRIHVAPVLLHLRVDVGVAVNLAGRGLEHLRAEPLGQPEHVDRAVDAGFDRLDRVALVMNRRGGTRQIIDFIDLKVERKGHIVADQFEFRVVQQMADVPLAAGVEIIDADHVVAFFEQPFAEMGAEKAAAAGHQNGFIFHCDS